MVSNHLLLDKGICVNTNINLTFWGRAQVEEGELLNNDTGVADDDVVTDILVG